jgi:hypothetical protein
MKLGIIRYLFYVFSGKSCFRSEELAPEIAAGSPEALSGDVAEDILM